MENKAYLEEPKYVRRLLIGIALLFLFVMLVLPLMMILTEAMKKGWFLYVKSLTDTVTLSAAKLTIQVTFIAVICNTLIALFASWALTRYHFRGRNLLITLIDLPFAISPVIAGLIFVLTFGRGGMFHEFLNKFHIQVIFAFPGILIATIFVTYPYVTRVLLPAMGATGIDEEEAAAAMGANLFTIFFKITLPKVKWALLYGVILCTARAMGEFGAVSVVSGHIRQRTNTLPLHIEILYNEYQFSASFAVASLLVIFAIIILILRFVVEKISKKEGF